MNYYTYAFLREDGTPYYIGKGKGRRCYSNTGRRIPRPQNKDRIIKLKENMSEDDAFRHEIYMIAILPNLRNICTGGQGRTGPKPEHGAKMKAYWQKVKEGKVPAPDRSNVGGGHKEITIGGITFKSVTAAARHFGCARTSIYDWIDKPHLVRYK